jgi:hypothetical protein
VVQINDLSRSLAAFDPISTRVVVVEMSKASWLVSGVVPGVEREPLKRLEPDATALLRLIERWRNEAVRAGRPISRIALAYEAGRDGFWLARWLIARGIEAHVIHSASVAVSRERKRHRSSGRHTRSRWRSPRHGDLVRDVSLPEDALRRRRISRTAICESAFKTRKVMRLPSREGVV